MTKIVGAVDLEGLILLAQAGNWLCMMKKPVRRFSSIISKLGSTAYAWQSLQQLF